MRNPLAALCAPTDLELGACERVRDRLIAGVSDTKVTCLHCFVDCRGAGRRTTENTANPPLLANSIVSSNQALNPIGKSNYTAFRCIRAF